jgi:nicotinate-nucleotide adenylyltransferase
MRLGIFGGTFDPPHLAHLILASEAAFQLKLDRVLWVLTPDPPHKNDLVVSPKEQRLALVQAAIQDDPAFMLSRVDLDRPPPHFAFETLRLLHEEYPGAAMIYLMGGDSLHDLPTWKLPQEFVVESDAIAVMRRPGDMVNLDILERQLPGLTEKVIFTDAPLVAISASEIRRRAPKGEPICYFLPPAVFQLIAREGWYGYRGEKFKQAGEFPA